jgi:hypothetical protein
MLILNPGLMGSMDDDHLIRVLECEPAIMRTPAEIELISRLEAALDELAERPEADAIDARVTEAIAQYPEEDFLEKLADRVFELGEKLRGDNKAEAHAIAKELTELGQTVANAAAYGREELDQILNPKKENPKCVK